MIELESKLMLLEEEKHQAQEANAEKEKELSKKVNQLTQVNNMKKMIVEKNAQLKSLRERLSKYENLDED